MEFARECGVKRKNQVEINRVGVWIQNESREKETKSSVIYLFIQRTGHSSCSDLQRRLLSRFDRDKNLVKRLRGTPYFIFWELVRVCEDDTVDYFQKKLKELVR